MAMPPELMALMQGAPPGPGAAMPPGAMGPPAPGPEAENPVEILETMIQLGRRYQEVEQDEEDRATMAKVLATLHQYLAREQSDVRNAMGSPSTQRLIGKAAGGL